MTTYKTNNSSFTNFTQEKVNMVSKAALFTRLLATTLALAVMGGCSLFENLNDTIQNRQAGDVDFDNATLLIAQAVSHPPEVSGEASGNDTPLADIFYMDPGSSVALQSFSGTIDPTGTTINNDFDGDAILNGDETTTNIWVADYPVVETSIATPITMKIKILESSIKSNDEITSEITASDTEKSTDRGSESIHRTESALKTEQFQDSISENNASSRSYDMSADQKISYSVPLMGGGGAGVSVASSDSWSQGSGYSKTTTEWADVPHTNNLNSNAIRLKSDSAGKLARNFRSEYSSKIDKDSIIESDAGFIRAAFYIKNLSVNMPVHISNILCSLMFETPDGTMLPVQSFYLRNQDYSKFEVDVYGGTEFGPYVVELSNLNTVEVSNAIKLGYTPKVFIISYDMTHVADSNYRSTILHYTGDNLKIIEENAKGRTALFRLIGPGFRENFRVAAFSLYENVEQADGRLDLNPNPCATNQGTTISPGIPMYEALRRLGCSGSEISVEFADYVIDLGDAFPRLNEGRFLIRGIKSIGSVQTTLPVRDGTCGAGASGGTDICIQKPISQWTAAELQNAGMWVVYSDGKFYTHTEYVKDASGDPRLITINTARENMTLPMVRGVESLVWAGDKFDLVYLSFADLLAATTDHGHNPLENGDSFSMTTAWDLSDVGDFHFNPNSNSIFLGQAGFGEQILLRFNLRDSIYLNPQFGTPLLSGGFNIYDDFRYNTQTLSYPEDSLKRSFNWNQVIDFEINMGLGGNKSDWFHLLRDVKNENSWSSSSDPDSAYPKYCGKVIDYVNQDFSLCIQLPLKHKDLTLPSDSIAHVYLRPALNSAYRNVIWPQDYRKVRKFEGEVEHYTGANANAIKVKHSYGIISANDTIYIGNDNVAKSISGLPVEYKPGYYIINLTEPLGVEAYSKTAIYVKEGLPKPVATLAVEDGFVDDWNNNVSISVTPTAAHYDQWMSRHRLPLPGTLSCTSPDNLTTSINCMGYYNTDEAALNWIGGYNYGVPLWNAWADGINFPDNVLVNVTSPGGLKAKLTSNYTSNNSDFLLNTNTVDYRDFNDTVAAGDRSLITWSTSDGVRLHVGGIVVDSLNKTQVTSEFTINTTQTADSWKAKVAASGDRALVAWTFDGSEIGATDVVRGRMVNVNDGSRPNPDFLIMNQGNWDVQVAASGNLALVVATDGAEVFGRIVDMDTGTPLFSEFPISTSTSNKLHLQVAVSGDRALVVWDSDYDPIGRVVQLSTGTPLGAELPLLNDPTGNQQQVKIAISGNRALTAIQSRVGADHVIRGRVIDIGKVEMIGNDFQISSLSTAWKGLPDVAISGDRGLVTWEYNDPVTSRDIQGRVVDVIKAEAIGSTFNINTTTNQIQRRIQLATVGDKIIAVWECRANGTYFVVRGREIDMIENRPLGSDFIISTTHFNNNNVEHPKIVSTGDRAIIHWNMYVYPDFIMHTYVNVLEYNTEKRFFFSKPLLQRNFEMEARFVEGW